MHTRRVVRVRGRLLAGVASALLLATVAGCGSDGGGESASAAGGDGGGQATEPLALRLNWTPYAADHAFFYYGVEQGIYEEEGIDLSIEPGNGSATVLKLVANGSDPIALVDASTMLKGIDTGADTVRATFGLTQTSPMAFIYKEDDPITSAEDLPGKSIGLTQGDVFSVVLPAVLAAQGLSEDDVEVRSVANPAGKEAALLRGQIDALTGYFTEQPLRLEATQDVELGWLPFSELGVNTLNMVVVANADWMDGNPDLAERFMRATQKAVEATAADPGGAADAFVAQVRNFDRDLALEQIEATIPLLHTRYTEDKPYGWMASEDWEETVSVLNEYGGTSIADVSPYYTNEYVERP